MESEHAPLDLLFRPEFLILTKETKQIQRDLERTADRSPIVGMSRKASNLRFGLWDNQGFLYRFVLMLLELKNWKRSSGSFPEWMIPPA